jgi:hypothetical protein
MTSVEEKEYVCVVCLVQLLGFNLIDPLLLLR